MKNKFRCSLLFGGVWLIISTISAVWWAAEASLYLPAVYVWWVIIGIALLPGFLMSSMFFSNLLHIKLKKYPHTNETVSIIMCAHNEESNVQQAIAHICRQAYAGRIHLIVVDNGSTDCTKAKILQSIRCGHAYCCINYVYCGIPGKANALNCGLCFVNTPHFITVDADTFLEEHAVQRIMDHIVARNSVCVAGNLFVQNAKASICTKMQIYDYLLSIAAIKRFQGSYQSTLVAQGAFSAYQTCIVRALGGWKDCLGEDIVLTYQLLALGKPSTYEPSAVGYTMVPQTLGNLYNQRKRGAGGMLEGFSTVKPWNQGSCYSRYFESVNLSIIYLDFAFLFGFVPGIIMALFGYYYLVGCLTLLAMAISVLLYSSVYRYQKRLGIPFQNSFIGFVFFLFCFQLIQSTASVHGYVTKLLKQKGCWK